MHGSHVVNGCNGPTNLGGVGYQGAGGAAAENALQGTLRFHWQSRDGRPESDGESLNLCVWTNARVGQCAPFLFCSLPHLGPVLEAKRLCFPPAWLSSGRGPRACMLREQPLASPHPAASGTREGCQTGGALPLLRSQQWHSEPQHPWACRSASQEVNGEHTTDVIVVGGGPAGLSSALILGRARRRVVIFDAGEKRNEASKVMHAVLGADGVNRVDFLEHAREQVRGPRSRRGGRRRSLLLLAALHPVRQGSRADVVLACIPAVAAACCRLAVQPGPASCSGKHLQEKGSGPAPTPTPPRSSPTPPSSCTSFRWWTST